MKLEKIINDDVENFFEIGKDVGRSTLDNFFSKTPYTKEEKEEEVKFFYEDIKFITRKWVLEIIWELETYKGSSFSQLKHQIKGISSRTLSDRLKELTKNKLINRNVQETHPPSVIYELSEKGKGFVEIMTLIILYLKKQW